MMENEVKNKKKTNNSKVEKNNTTKKTNNKNNIEMPKQKKTTKVQNKKSDKEDLKKEQIKKDKENLEKKLEETKSFDDNIDTVDNSIVKLVQEELKKEEKVSEKSNNKNNGKLLGIILLIVGIFIVLGGVYFIYHNYLYEGLEITKIEESSKINDDNTKTVTVYVDGNQNSKCSYDNENWISVNFGKCSFNLESGNYNFIVKNNDKVVNRDYNLVIDELKSISFNTDELYIAIGEKYKPVLNMEYIGVSKENLKWESSNSDIVSVTDGIVLGLKEGTSEISAIGSNGLKSSIKVIVTNLLVKPEINDKKNVVKCKQYTEEEAAILDKALFARVKDKGEGTRAALVEVSRFLTLSFPYKIPYFYENGRMDYPTSGVRKADGEGRYYHKGLYLAESKFKDIDTSYKGPAIWGCPLTNLENHGKYKPGNKMPNGLDCSGYVSWCLYNSGQDVGDIGAGINDNVKEMSDVGEMHTLDYDFVNSGNFKVGDIIARWGHTALIAGMDDKYIYISESLLKGVRIEKYNYKDKSSVLYTKGWYTYINKMDKVYSSDGEYSDMWLNAKE